MKNLKLNLAILVILFSFTKVYSQVAKDTIYKKSGLVLIAKVTEVLPDIVKYIYPIDKDSIVMGIDKDELQKIVFSNGAVQMFVDAMINPEHYSDQHKHDLKIDFIAPAMNHLTIDYEKSIKPGMSWESGVIIVGVGSSSGFNPASGAIVGGGIKFIHTPDFTSRGQHYTHILKGSYVRLQAYAGYYTENYTSNSSNNYYPYSSSSANVNDKYTVGGFHVQFGKQYVFDDIFLLDIYYGIGYSFVNYSTDKPNNNNLFGSGDSNGESYNYAFTRFGSSSPLSVSWGLKIGVLF